MRKEDLFRTKTKYKGEEEGKKLKEALSKKGFNVSCEWVFNSSSAQVYISGEGRITYGTSDERSGFFDSHSYKYVPLGRILEEIKQKNVGNFEIIYNEEFISINDGEDCIEIKREELPDLIKSLKEI